MIDLEAARALLDFGRRIGGGHRAEEQLRGAVAIHNILRRHRVAYLADEVGMGKTYVALGALALFRHFEPSFRALIIAPRENIQKKWQKELSNFVAYNVRYADMRVAALDGRPARPLVSCGNLIELVNEATLDPDRDFFVRMTSFSLPLGKTGEDWKKMRDGLRDHLPWLSNEAFDLRSKEQFKKNFARALCCALPKFDLVIVDEAHNLKHGFSASSSARNQALGEAFGRHAEGDDPDPRLFPGYGPRAERVLFLSATPLDETYRHVWNQLDLFGLAGPFRELRDNDISDSRKKEVAGQFLVRRVTSIRVAGREHTKNMYRREWRAGGVATHDEPIRVEDERQRLVVALVQKKVSEILSGRRFNRSFQIGMLASFESFLETARLKRDDDQAAVFDDSEQTDVALERDGIDVRDLNRLAGHYRQTFGREMPHPKMDAVIDNLATAWLTGKKALVFVRRVASVKELKRKLDERYDDWLIPTLRGRLPEAVREALDRVVERYRREKELADAPGRAMAVPSKVVGVDLEIEDRGGHDTFFAWFFRGEGPKGIVSGANIQARFIKASGAYATFFADNHVMDLLGAGPETVVESLVIALGLSRSAVIAALRARARCYISKKAKVVTRAARMEAAQAAALELLHERGHGELALRARIIWEERYAASRLVEHAADAPPEIANALERATFFTALGRT
jgi:superfamily II DNA or RNA helicase